MLLKSVLPGGWVKPHFFLNMSIYIGKSFLGSDACQESGILGLLDLFLLMGGTPPTLLALSSRARPLKRISTELVPFGLPTTALSRSCRRLACPLPNVFLLASLEILSSLFSVSHFLLHKISFSLFSCMFTIPVYFVRGINFLIQFSDLCQFCLNLHILFFLLGIS